jgi:hypothetical protein
MNVEREGSPGREQTEGIVLVGLSLDDRKWLEAFSEIIFDLKKSGRELKRKDNAGEKVSPADRNFLLLNSNLLITFYDRLAHDERLVPALRDILRLAEREERGEDRVD